MPRFNVYNPETEKWRCFSTIVDDWVTEWMNEECYEKWRINEYGDNCGDVRSANQMTIEDAEERIREREEWEENLD